MKIFFFYLLPSIIYLVNCVPALKVDKICDTGDPAKFLREAFMWRTTTNQEFYCSVRIRDRVYPTGSGTTTGTPVALPTITFANTLYSGFQGEAYNITPTLGGGAPASCTSVPPLPVGLSINATTCAITGTATTGGAGASYTITATNATGSATASTKIKVLGPNAFRVYGQFGSFTCNVINNNSSCVAGSTAPPITSGSANNLNTVRGVAVDSNDNVYISDSGNNRVLYFANGSTTATRVYGQENTMTCGAPNNLAGGGCVSGGATADAGSLNTPYGIAINLQNDLLVTDHANHRVVRFPASGGTTINNVTGQASFSGSGENRGAGAVVSTNAGDGLRFPYTVAFDPQGNMYIGDGYNKRVLQYPTGANTPNLAYGQANMSTDTAPTPTNSGFALETSAIADSSKVYVGEVVNNRVLIFNTKGVNSANVVLGQTAMNLLTPGICNASSIKPAGTSQVIGLGIDSNGNLFVSSYSDHRILIFKPPFANNMNATYVLGATSLTNFTECSSGTATNKINSPAGNTAFDSFGNFYLPDQNNNRVIVF